MIREPKFLISKRLYAVDMSSLRERGSSHFRIAAVWFRRKSGVTAACVGELWDTQRETPADAVAFLAALDDGRYGGDCQGRWDGTGYWGAAERPERIAEHLALLRPMLAGYPEIPPGYDGWWRF